MTQNIKKIFCDVCKKEIDVNAKSEFGFHNHIRWSREFYIKDRDGVWVSKDVNDMCSSCYAKICEFQTELWNAFNKDEGE